MPRIRWFRFERGATQEEPHWSWVALPTAALFANILLWDLIEGSLWAPGNLPQFVLVQFGAAVALSMIFAGPALAAQAAKRPLFEIIESSLGTVPAWGIRVCCVWYVTDWLTVLLGVAPYPDSFVSRWDVSAAGGRAIQTAVLALWLLTAFSDERGNARLALFSNKLGLAVLVAALVRVRDGLPKVLDGIPGMYSYSAGFLVWRGVSELLVWVGPMVFLAAASGYRMKGRKQVWMATAAGVTIPLFLTGLLLGIIGAATLASRFYQPSLAATVSMALCSKAARSSLPGLVFIFALTMFGAGRFGLRSLLDLVSVPALGRWSIAVFAALAALALSVASGGYPYSALHRYASVPATGVAIAAAILTGDAISGTSGRSLSTKIDGVGFAALCSGAAVAAGVHHWAANELWRRPEILPAYGAAFLVCAAGRVLQRRRAPSPY